MIHVLVCISTEIIFELMIQGWQCFAYAYMDPDPLLHAFVNQDLLDLCRWRLTLYLLQNIRETSRLPESHNPSRNTTEYL
jgi:hypothetical protein